MKKELKAGKEKEKREKEKEKNNPVSKEKVRENRDRSAKATFASKRHLFYYHLTTSLNLII